MLSTPATSCQPEASGPLTWVAEMMLPPPHPTSVLSWVHSLCSLHRAWHLTGTQRASFNSPVLKLEYCKMNIDVLNADPDLWLPQHWSSVMLVRAWLFLLLRKTYGSSSQSFLPACYKWVTGVPGDTICSKSHEAAGGLRLEARVAEPDPSHDQEPQG